MKKRVSGVLFLVFYALSWASGQVNFEFRGVWVATVENIDWPSQKGLSVEAQKTSFISMIDSHQRNGINAIIMQIRPAADAFYPSLFEPWSEYLMGKQGTPPDPYYDPLAFMIEETHKRGMEFHAWLNPYRAVFNVSKSSVSPTHITRQHPEWFLTYGTIKYFNPGLPEVRAFVGEVVRDIVKRYDVDGIHMDDYFYPYRIPGKEFPDEKAYRLYGNGLSKDDWRRSNCDSIIKNIYEIICETNVRVKFGISPFGVWRNKSQDLDGSNTKAGVTCYDELYANILLWLDKGWIDYVAPQLYWERGHKLCDYDELLGWWNKHTFGKHLYIGHAPYRANSNAAWRNKNEIPNQIKGLRNYETTQGSIFFSSKDLVRNANGWGDSLRYNYYALPAIVPPMDWIDSILPANPEVIKGQGSLFTFNCPPKTKIKGFAIFALPPLVDAKIEYATLVKILTATTSAGFDKAGTIAPANNRLFVATISINNNISSWVELK
ncbi:glycoside hydrolase family 10 protein [Parasediminibacterium sp. JCM 36343]|uniref:glycoside hydrolase family 10 protein n=1 Tax=Parasediminibacterium sp. JCM 36343 TaxID=3374279 RepID=UPI00397A1DA6